MHTRDAFAFLSPPPYCAYEGIPRDLKEKGGIDAMVQGNTPYPRTNPAIWLETNGSVAYDDMAGEEAYKLSVCH